MTQPVYLLPVDGKLDRLGLLDGLPNTSTGLSLLLPCLAHTHEEAVMNAHRSFPRVSSAAESLSLLFSSLSPLFPQCQSFRLTCRLRVRPLPLPLWSAEREGFHCPLICARALHALHFPSAAGLCTQRKS